MNNIRSVTDKTAIGLSLLSAIHCLLFPFAMVLLPSIAALSLDGEAFHLWMVIAVIPTSAFALTLGCKRHKQHRVAVIGVLGLLVITLTALAGEHYLGEVLEKSLTVLGAMIITLGHYRNYRLCQQADDCGCPAEENQ